MGTRLTFAATGKEEEESPDADGERRADEVEVMVSL